MTSITENLNLEVYSVQELANIKKNLENDVEAIMDSYNSFKFLYKKFEDGKLLINNISKQEDKTPEILVPLTNSLYIPGQLTSNDNFMVDLGTGYFADRNATQTIDYCDQTLKVIKANAEKMANEINKKQEMRDKVNIQFQKKYQQHMKEEKEKAGK